MRRSKAQKIEDLINEMLKESKLGVGLKEYQLINSWEKVTGKAIANATTKIYIHSRKLFVSVHSSIIRNELMMVRDGLLHALNQEVNGNVIDEIVIR